MIIRAGSRVWMGIGQAGLLRPAAWPGKVWSGLIKFRPGSGSGLIFRPDLIKRPGTGPKKDLLSLQASLVSISFKKKHSPTKAKPNYILTFEKKNGVSSLSLPRVSPSTSSLLKRCFFNLSPSCLASSLADCKFQSLT